MMVYKWQEIIYIILKFYVICHLSICGNGDFLVQKLDKTLGLGLLKLPELGLGLLPEFELVIDICCSGLLADSLQQTDALISHSPIAEAKLCARWKLWLSI